jgi:hypothetical protein
MPSQEGREGGKWEKRILERRAGIEERGGGVFWRKGMGSRQVEERGEERICGGAAPAEFC